MNPQAGALCLDVTYSSARVALLGRRSARLSASSGFMARLTAVVAETLLRGAVFCDVPHWPENGYDVLVRWIGFTHNSRT